MIGLSAQLRNARAQANPDAAITGPLPLPTVAHTPAPRPRETFVVFPFINGKQVKALDYLESGLPAFIAERLSQHAPLRFVGGPALLPPRATTADARWRLTGRFERRPDWKLSVTVELSTSDNPAQVVARAERLGGKDEAAATALQAALEAFAGLPGVQLPPASKDELRAFGRDPYAFVLYGRGLAVLLGQAGFARNPERAKELLGKSLLIDPKVPETRRLLGLYHLDAGRPGHARAMWTYALDVQPNYAAAVSALAALDRTQGAPSARELYERLVALDPDDVDARRTLGEILSEAGALAEAQTQLEAALVRSPGDLRARRALALVLASRRAGNELVTELETLVRLDPDDVDARMDLGAAYVSLGRVIEASTTYEEVLRRRPRMAPALKFAADLWRARGDIKKAAGYYERLRRLQPEDPRPVFLLGTAYYEAGNMEAAQRMFEEGAQFPGMLGEAYSNLGAIALRRGQNREALWFLRLAAKRRPNKAGVRYNHALALRALDRHADALNELRAAEAADPNDAGVRFLAGVVALRLGLLKEAADDFREAVRLDPAQENARHNLALLEPLVRPGEEGAVTLIDAVPAVPPPVPPAPRAEPRQARRPPAR